MPLYSEQWQWDIAFHSVGNGTLLAFLCAGVVKNQTLEPVQRSVLGWRVASKALARFVTYRLLFFMLGRSKIRFWSQSSEASWAGGLIARAGLCGFYPM